MTRKPERFTWARSAQAMLELIDVHAYYGESYVLQGISLKVQAGAIVAVLGRNGMGKTTTIRSIMGFTPPRRGKILFKGEDIAGLPSHRIAQKGIGLVPQGRRIFPSLSVEENLIMAARGGGENAWNLDTVHSLFPILKERCKYPGTSLSGGQQQMLSIGRALMTNPELLLMDEPSEGLAPIIVQEVERAIAHLKESGFSILLVEQNLPMALSIADYIYIISKGAVVYECMPEKLKGDAEAQSKYLGVAA